MLGHLRRSLRALPVTTLVTCDPSAISSVWSSQAKLLAFDSCWCIKTKSRGFSTDNKVTNDRRGYQRMELKPSTATKEPLPFLPWKRDFANDFLLLTHRIKQPLHGEILSWIRTHDDPSKGFVFFHDNDAIIDRIQKSTKELKQGPVGKNLSSAEKRKFLIDTILGLEDSKEVVYGTLDAWVAFEQDFPLVSIKQAIVALEKEEQWHRIVQVIKWMLSKGQGNTMRTYEQLVCALEKDNRADEAHIIWEKKMAHDLHPIPWRFCRRMIGIYYRNNSLDKLVKLFKELEACGRKPPSKDIIRKVEDAYEMLGLLEQKKILLDKYKDLYNKPSSKDRKKRREFKSGEKNEKAADGRKHCEPETFENLPVHPRPSDKEPDVTS